MNEARSTGTDAATDVPLTPDLPATTSARDLPATKPSRFTTIGSLPRLIGKVGAGIAVTGVIIGALLGTPSAGPAVHSPETARVVRVESPRHAEVGRVVQGLSGDVKSLLPPELRTQDLLHSVGYVSFSVRAEQGLVAANSRLEVEPGTRITAHLDRYGLSFSASPSVGWRIDWLPDAHLERVSYDFQTGRFTASASGFGPDSWYSSKVEDLANENLARYLPEAMRRPGYDPTTDPQLEANVAQLVDAITGATHSRGATPAASASRTTASSPTTGASPSTASTPTSGAATAEPKTIDFRAVTAPSLSIEYDLAEARTIAIPGSEYKAWFEAGTRIWVTTSTTGPVSDPTLERIQVSFSRPVVVSAGKDKPGAVARIDISSMTLDRNAQLTMDYELGPERLVDGARALITLFAIAADPRVANHVGNMEPTRMERLRGDVQAQIDNQVEPQLIELLRRNDHAIQGTSLLRFFGIEADRLAPAAPSTGTRPAR